MCVLRGPEQCTTGLELKQQTLISHCSGGWKHKTKVAAGLFPPEASPWLEDGRLLPVSSCGLPSGCVCVLISSSYEDTSHAGLRPTPVTEFYLNPPFKERVCEYSHILRDWG